MRQPTPKSLQPYSVLLKCPEALTGGFLETEHVHVQATSYLDAIAQARQQQMEEYGDYVPELDLTAEDWIVLLVTEGHQTDIRPEA